MSKNYIVYNAKGEILRTGTCPDDHLAIQPGPGELVMEGEASDDKHCVKNGKIVAKSPATSPQPSYEELRRAAYPSLLEFADAYYWQIRGDSSLMQTYLAKIDAVKAKYPKPN